jgi:two-component system, NarL family, sensor histidine kinase LiaS
LKRVRNFLTSLRGRLILTYTLVTVLALLALEVLILLLLVFFFSATNADYSGYISDAIYTLFPRAARYMEPGGQDQRGLQTWLEQVYASRHASSEPIGWFDSPAAILVDDEPLYVLSPQRVVLAQTPQTNSLIGQTFTPPNRAAEQVLQRALGAEFVPLRLYTTLPDGNLWIAIPIIQGEARTVVGAIVLTIHPPPPLIVTLLPILLVTVIVTGILLLIAVAPFGARFGFFMSRGLTRRLGNLSAAADAWSEGNFSVVPQDPSGDEISVLGTRLRNMADRIQSLLRTQQELAMLQERNRIARELHDTVKQQNFATLMQIRAARNRLASDPSAAAELLQEAERLVKTSQQELGLMITELRPAALDGQGLARALQTYLETWSRQSNIAATFHVQNETRVSAELEQSLYRVAQEALANVARHSQATTVNLLLAYAREHLTLTLTDNGIGFDVNAARGFGLNSMKERLNALGGALSVSSASGQGTTVRAQVPRRVNE